MEHSVLLKRYRFAVLLVMSSVLVSCSDQFSMFERDKSEPARQFSADEVQLQKVNTDAFKELTEASFGVVADDKKGNRMPETQATITETFESGTKTSYAAADVTLGTGVWNLSDALIGTSTSDRKSGTKSVRIQNTGKATMKFNRTTGAGTVSVKHAKYGTDANTSWELWRSLDNGATWAKVGSTISTTSTTLATAAITANIPGTVRFEIRKVSGGTARLNIDDIIITDYSAGPAVTEVESNNSTSFANTVPVPSSTSTGVISTTTDVDYFKFSVTSGQSISLNMTVPSGVDYDLYLLNPSGTQVASSENGTGASEAIAYSATVSGTFYFAVQSYSGSSTTAAYSVALTVTTSVPPSSSVHLTFGNPSSAIASASYPANYLMEKPQFAMSYHRDRGIPNWVSWHLDATWTGSAARQDDFRNDTSLPSGWYQVGGSSYSGSGFDRGHNCPSADRTKTVADNSATFLMTNMIPQAPDNNQGPWANMENYLRTLVSAGNEVYIVMGQYGVGGTGSSGAANTIDAGRVTVPDRVWKVAIVIPSGTNDVSRVTTSTRVIAVDMPNDQGIRSVSWGTYRTTVDAIEAATGFDLFSAISDSIEATLESRVDNGPTS
jgi:DNA/RNA endonuclease G (NUC1)